ncbi:serine hydrolase domain-containing protein [Arthrobacter antioxidans]|uniref:serine hydrolase domain-containing protein n=1 Tax=Arthrobacter antioxidans TaxID=2895818 RepID=UPI0020000BDC|nr:serine hydrolase domain-containing protein [Arthrobacter antioxidans]
MTTGVAPSAVAAVDIAGQLFGPIAAGAAVAFGPDKSPLSANERVTAQAETVYDLASVTKVVSALTLLALVGEGVLDLDRPIGAHLPSFRVGERSSITLRHLLTHTSGLPGTWDGWRTVPARPGRDALLADILSLPLAATPGTAFAYSCVGFTVAMALAEEATGQPWPELVTAKVLDPLAALDPRAASLTFGPDRSACAATELQVVPVCGSVRGMVRGEVHDETAWALGGAVANAGLFGTASAVLALGTVLRDRAEALVPEALAVELWQDQLPRILGSHRGPGFGHGLGLRIGQREWMGAHGRTARGHNGFAGTSLLMDRDRGVVVVLLTNRVHPSREHNAMAGFRSALADAVFAAAPDERA